MPLRVPSHLSHSVFPVIVTAGNRALALVFTPAANPLQAEFTTASPVNAVWEMSSTLTLMF